VKIVFTEKAVGRD